MTKKDKKLKREEAMERQEAYNLLSPKQKIAKLDMKGWRAKKERARLAKQMQPSE